MMIALSATASAALTLHIDTTSEKFWLTGSTSGEFGSYLGGSATWVISSNSSSTSTGLVPADGAALSDIATTTNGVNITNVRIGATGSNFTFKLSSDSTATTTITGTGSAFAIDYSGADSTVKANFEGGIGFTTTSQTEGSTFEQITIVAGTIPEPSTSSLLLGSAALLVTRRKR